jgi:hypothetical protein
LNGISLIHSSRDWCHQGVDDKVQDQREIDDGFSQLTDSTAWTGNAKCEGYNAEGGDGREPNVAGCVGGVNCFLLWLLRVLNGDWDNVLH